MVTAGWKIWFVVGAYVPPNNQLTVNRIDQALENCLVGTEALLIGDLKDHLV